MNKRKLQAHLGLLLSSLWVVHAANVPMLRRSLRDFFRPQRAEEDRELYSDTSVYSVHSQDGRMVLSRYNQRKVQVLRASANGTDAMNKLRIVDQAYVRNQSMKRLFDLRAKEGSSLADYCDFIANHNQMPPTKRAIANHKLCKLGQHASFTSAVPDHQEQMRHRYDAQGVATGKDDGSRFELMSAEAPALDWQDETEAEIIATAAEVKTGKGAGVLSTGVIAGVPVNALPAPRQRWLLKALVATRKALPAWSEIAGIKQCSAAASNFTSGPTIEHELRLLAASPGGEEAVRAAMQAQIPDSESDEEEEELDEEEDCV